MLEIGSLVDGKYKILNKIGQGGMSVVYLAMNEKANKQWAIKEVRKDGKKDFDVIRQNLVVETDMLKKLRHAHLPSIVDVIDGDGTFLIVMDYIEGNPLNVLVNEQGAQSQEDVIDWAKQLCDVLGYLHSRTPAIIYRDMKPSNVMLKPDGNVMLIDFGTAREYKNKNMVEDTTCLGTQGYAAPEQFGGHGQTDARTDIYCLGATMYHLVTGHNPAKPPYEMYPIRQWNPKLSAGLEEVILKCTKKNPEDRYQSCSELMYALEHYNELDISYKKTQRRKMVAFTATLVVSATLFGVAGYMRHKENSYKSQNYDTYYAYAGTATLESEFKEMVNNALSLDDTSPEIYDLIRTKYLEYFNEDEQGTGTKSISFKELNSIKEIVESDGHLDNFKKADPLEYYNFCYNLGLNLWAYMDNGSADAVAWFSKVENYSDGNKNNNRNASNAQLFIRLAGYVNASAGNGVDIFDDDVDYSEEWNDLVSVYELTVSTDDNYTDDKFKAYTYQLILNQIVSKAKEYNGYIDSSSMFEMIDNIEEQVNGNLAEVVESSYDGVFDKLIETARGKVNSAITGSGEAGGDS
jgi:serine/threonine-protein kinase